MNRIVELRSARGASPSNSTATTTPASRISLCCRCRPIRLSAWSRWPGTASLMLYVWSFTICLNLSSFFVLLTDFLKDINFKVTRQTTTTVVRTTIQTEFPWKLQQVQDAANHLQQAIYHIDDVGKNYKFKYVAVCGLIFDFFSIF